MERCVAVRAADASLQKNEADGGENEYAKMFQRDQKKVYVQPEAS